MSEIESMINKETEALKMGSGSSGDGSGRNDLIDGLLNILDKNSDNEGSAKGDDDDSKTSRKPDAHTTSTPKASTKAATKGITKSSKETSAKAGEAPLPPPVAKGVSWIYVKFPFKHANGS